MRFLFLFSLFLRFVFEFFVYEILGLERLEVNGFFFFFFSVLWQIFDALIDIFG